MSEPIPERPERLEEVLSTEALAHRVGAQPITSVEDLHVMARPELWDSDEDYHALLADLHASRRANIV